METEIAGVCKSIDDRDLWFIVCCQAAVVTPIPKQELVWGLTEGTKIPPTPPSTDSVTRHYMHACGCLNITSPVFSSSSRQSSASLSPFASLWACSRWAGWVWEGQLFNWRNRRRPHLVHGCHVNNPREGNNSPSVVRLWAITRCTPVVPTIWLFQM